MMMPAAETNPGTLEIVPAKAAVVPIQKESRGLALRTIDDMWRFAQFVMKSGELAPPQFKTAESILVAMQMGAEVGLSPMASLKSIAVINGRPSLYGDALLAVARSSPAWDESGFKESFTGELSNLTAVCRVRRKGGNVITSEFSVMDAKLAKLWGKAGPWTQYPQRMLKWRARGFAIRDGFSDALQGFVSFEEARDTEPQKAPLMVDVPAVESLSGTRAQQLARQLEAPPKTAVEPRKDEEPLLLETGKELFSEAGNEANALVLRREKVCRYFAGIDVSIGQLLRRVDGTYQMLSDLTSVDMDLLYRVATAIKEGDTTVEAEFPLQGVEKEA